MWCPIKDTLGQWVNRYQSDRRGHMPEAEAYVVKKCWMDSIRPSEDIAQSDQLCKQPIDIIHQT
jgi:hypothetical protein